ncbi:MAG: alpha-glucan family phosphorylase [Gammaproteobacteria bacterium]|nr:alpha-glucan family phosphorylase [Gammaproteobacteria bacterium]
MEKNVFLIEVSWEVCNKVGGIYTVLRSKLQQVVRNFGTNYLLIGPLLENNKYFVESAAPTFSQIKDILSAKNINSRVGYWDTEGQPMVILVDYKTRYKIDLLLYTLWTDFGVDSLASNYDYQEPILFATLAGEVISALSNSIMAKNMRVVAHFHEWLCGAGLLYLKKNQPDVATVFTTHATVVGRSLASRNILAYNLPGNFDVAAAARKLGVFAKHSLEKASATEADCFTCVSAVNADEANKILGKYPDKIVLDGLNIEHKKQALLQVNVAQVRAKLLEVATKVIGKPIAENALLWVTSGRYELHNKGFDLILKTLAQLETTLDKDAPPIVLFMLIAANWHDKRDSLLEPSNIDIAQQKSALGIATHKLYDPDNDSIIKLVNELNLKQPYRKIHIVFSDAYLNGADGVFDIPYEQINVAADLTLFPSFYEPWGYTPLESIACATPTVTSDLAGFGGWVNSLQLDLDSAIYVLKRKNIEEDAAIKALLEYLLSIVTTSANHDYTTSARQKAFNIATLADWQNFYHDYLDSYDQALQFNALTYEKFDPNDPENQFVTSIHATEVFSPRFHALQYESIIPANISGLRELAYNFWWSWHDEAKELFASIDPDVWRESHFNPVKFLNLVSFDALNVAASKRKFVARLNEVLTAFHDYALNNKEIIRFCSTTSVSKEHPIAYFCMEYGVDECLPIYSGGLGILAGDYLKSVSDLKLPVVAVGLFYRQGYFRQTINSQGEQVALYEAWDPNQIPMKLVTDESGKVVLASVQILGRIVYVKAWEAKVGHVNLYLLDTNVNENTPEDRAITDWLYGGEREERLLQEIILGVAGTRFLIEKLNIKPSVYHLNEGHSAFLLLERVKSYCHQGFSFAEACEIVRYSSVFTTHTPVPAGNETFAKELIEKYFTNYISSAISLEQIFALAGGVNNGDFSMTALAMRLTISVNAVSALHSRVARAMWQKLWPGFMESEIPIDFVTNGVHLCTWIGNSMQNLFAGYLGSECLKKQDDPKNWEKVFNIRNADLWNAHQEQKQKLVNLAKELVLEQYTLRNENKTLINASLQALSDNPLLIGLSRRFTPYKRNDLILKDKERLARLLTDKKRPVVMLIAGKAHPADEAGKELIREIIITLREERFAGHIIFLEEYNIALAKALVQGVDVWLNTPILGREACGTSGMKVGVNGGLNFSTLDGWWDEAYNEKIGWHIKSLTFINDIARRNDLENVYLLNTLESKIIPLYYDNHHAGFNNDWVNMMKSSIVEIAANYNSNRMARDYINNIYCPVVVQFENICRNNFLALREIVAWKQNVATLFNTLKIKAILINGVKDGKITSAGLVKIKVILFSGKLSSRELKVEFVLVKNNGNGSKKAVAPIIVALRRVSPRETGILTYLAEYQLEATGFYSYGIRVYPYNSMLFRAQDCGVVCWG